MINPTIGHYEILGKLGQGGMGVVHLARDSRLNRQVALKVLPPGLAATSEARQRFTREAQSASALNSPNIVTIYEIGRDGETDFIAMEYVRGETLAEVLQHGPLDFDTAIHYAVQITAALSAAHSAGIVHRDLKPGNVMIGADGLVKVLDFGLAKPVEPPGDGSEPVSPDTKTTPLTQFGMAIGTLAYMSPEQALGAALDTRSDIFSLGIVLYEMFTGKAPFSGPSPGDTFRRLQLDEPEPPAKVRPGLPPELDRILLKALAKKPDNRYQSTRELENELKRLAAPSGATLVADWRALPGLSSIPSGLWDKLTSRRVLLGVAGVAILLSIAAWEPWKSTHKPLPAAQRWFDQGTAAIRDGTYHTASLALERAVAADPAFSLAHIRLAESYFELDAPDKAKEELLRAVPQDSSSDLTAIDELYLQAVRLTLTADFEGAAQKYASIRDALPADDRPSALVDYGRALEKAENINGAMIAYEEAARMQSQYPSAFLRLGMLHRRKLDQARAGESFRQAESLYRSLGNMEGIAEVNYQRGVLLNSLGKASEAKAILDQALDIARTAGNDQQQIAILLQLSGVMHRLNGPEQARDYASQAISLARSKGLEPLSARGLIDLGNTYFVAGGAAEARDYFTQALDTARRNNSRRTEARALLSLGSLDIQLGNPQQGLKNVELALAFYRLGGYRKETSQGLLLAGRAHRSLGDYEGAYKAFEEQHRRAHEVNDVEQVQLSLEAMGSARALQGRLPEALEYFQGALATGGKSSNSMAQAYTRLNLANAQMRLGRYDEAGKTIRVLESPDSPAKANRVVAVTIAKLRAAEALSRRQFAASALIAKRLLAAPGLSASTSAEVKSILANALANSGEAQQALRTAGEAVQEASKAGLSDLAADALAAQAVALHQAGKYAEAVESATAAQQKDTASGNRERAWRALALAARASRAAGRTAQAAEYAASSAAALAEVEALFGPAGFATYSRRPDIEFDRNALNSLTPSTTPFVRVKGPSK
jgi:serine/threonine protein kinase